MNPTEYTKLAKRTESLNDPLADTELSRLLHSILGCSDEAGELIKIMKDHLFYEREIVFTSLKEEYGDLLWYIAIGLNAINSSFEEVMELNIAKLRSRYPVKFAQDKAINRDMATELSILEACAKEVTQKKNAATPPPDDTKTWKGSPITNCQICGRKIATYFIDGKTKLGPWGILCPTCHAKQGFGLGLGRGQKYELVGRMYIKISG